MIFKNFKKIIASTITIMALVAVNPISAHAEWRNSGSGWWYSQGGDYYATGWKQINGKWYYFGSDGYMKTGWLNDSGKWYYLNKNGSMARNRYVGNYYVNSNGVYEPQNKIGTTTTTRATSQGITLEYPSSWTKSTHDNNTTYDLDNKGTGIVQTTIDLEGHSEKEFLEEFCKELSNAEDFDKIEEVEVSEQIINNKRVDVVDCIIKVKQFKMKTHNVIFYNNDKAYIFIIIGINQILSEDMDAINKMLNTVEFK